MALVALVLAGASCVDDKTGDFGVFESSDPPFEIDALLLSAAVGGAGGGLEQAALPLASVAEGPGVVGDIDRLPVIVGGRSTLALDVGDATTALLIGLSADGFQIRGSYRVDLEPVRATAVRALTLELRWTVVIDSVPGEMTLIVQAIDSEGRAGSPHERRLDVVICGGSGDPCPAECGNERIEDGEQCDGPQLGGADCASEGFDGGTLLCAASCAFDTSACVVCGDGVRNGDEQCDGSDLGEATCENSGFGGGTLQCDDACRFDASSCDSCGDGVAQGSGEACDGEDLRGATCASEGFDGGELTCTTGCAFDTAACYRCGDGSLDPGEVCDGTDLGGRTCRDSGFDGGPLSCDESCRLDTSQCFDCGDGSLDPGEPCDGTELGGATCESEGFDGGELRCLDSCAFDTSSCYTCGDDERNPGEACDGADLDGATCSDEGFDGGELSCAGDCTFDTSACYVCGDGTQDAGEPCDGDDLGGATCQSLGFSGGELACAGDCEYDTTACESPCSVDLELSNAIGNDLNPQQGQIFVSSLPLALRVRTPEVGLERIAFDVTSSQFGVSVLGCDPIAAGFDCEVVPPESGDDAIARIRVVGGGAAAIGPSPNPQLAAEIRLRLEFPTAASTAFVSIGFADPSVESAAGASCLVDSAEAGSVRVTDN